MMCFRSCFCLPNKRKKPTSSSSVISRNAGLSSYRPLASFLEDDDDPELVGNPGESRVIHKKVRFNLNVQAYEPIPREDSDCLESDAGEIVGQTCYKEKTPIIASKEGSAYPSNYRYQNCRDSSDEEDSDSGFFYDESDLELEHDEDNYLCDDESCGDCCQLDWRSSKDEVPTRLDSVRLSSEGREWISLVKLPDEKEISPVQPLSTTTNTREPCATMRSSENARLRNHYAHLVLNPVENSAQWKTVKARATLPNRKPNKENMERERKFESAATSCKSNSQAQHIPVNASLSSWLVPVGH